MLPTMKWVDDIQNAFGDMTETRYGCRCSSYGQVDCVLDEYKRA